jgi:hypothetical protein
MSSSILAFLVFYSPIMQLQLIWSHDGKWISVFSVHLTISWPHFRRIWELMWWGPSHNIFALVQEVFEAKWLTFAGPGRTLQIGRWGTQQNSEKSTRIVEQWDTGSTFSIKNPTIWEGKVQMGEWEIIEMYPWIWLF